jgi:hypothetical protein
MLTMAKDGLALIFFGGARLAHGVGDGFAFMFLGLLGIGVAIWGISRAMDGESKKS